MRSLFFVDLNWQRRGFHPDELNSIRYLWLNFSDYRWFIWMRCLIWRFSASNDPIDRLILLLTNMMFSWSFFCFIKFSSLLTPKFYLSSKFIVLSISKFLTFLLDLLVKSVDGLLWFCCLNPSLRFYYFYLLTIFYWLVRIKDLADFCNDIIFLMKSILNGIGIGCL